MSLKQPAYGRRRRGFPALGAGPAIAPGKTVRGSVPSDEGKIPPRGRTPVRTRYVSPARGVAGYASRRRRYLLAQRPKLHRTTVHGLARTDTGRAIGLPVL